MKGLLFLASVVPLAAAAQVAAAPAMHSLSGEQFVRMITHAEPLSDAQYRDRDVAYGYLDGVKDATLGVAWCPSHPRKTFELAYDAADYIAALPAADRKGSAATLLLRFLSLRYPCAKGVSR